MQQVGAGAAQVGSQAGPQASGAQHEGSGAQQVGSGAQHVSTAQQLDFLCFLNSFFNQPRFFLPQQGVSQQVGSGAQQVGSGAQQLGSGAQHDGSGAQHEGSGAQQEGSGAQPQLCFLSRPKPASALALKQQTIMAAESVNHFIEILLLFT